MTLVPTPLFLNFYFRGFLGLVECHRNVKSIAYFFWVLTGENEK